MKYHLKFQKVQVPKKNFENFWNRHKYFNTLDSYQVQLNPKLKKYSPYKIMFRVHFSGKILITTVIPTRSPQTWTTVHVRDDGPCY